MTDQAIFYMPRTDADMFACPSSPVGDVERRVGRAAMAETVGALAADAASTGEVGSAFRLLRMAAAHAAAATGSGGGDGGTESQGAAGAAAARRVLCVTADAYHRAATAVTAASLAHHQRKLAGLEAGALLALDGEDLFQPAPGGLPVCKELVVDPEMNLNYAVQYYLRALRSFPWLAAPGCGGGGGGGGNADGGDVEAAAAARALEAAYTSLGRHLLAAGRYTKAQQHFSQGVELFRSLGAPASTAAMCALLRAARALSRPLARSP
jgi:tetratricopeptide (TPR) repeat protein